MSRDENSNLTSNRDNIDYIIITHEAFYDDITALKNYRSSKGLNVEIVKIQDIYDEFSYGLKDARAIRAFLMHAYNNWKTGSHPTYVLLVGDASIDYRDDTGNFTLKGNVDYVPTYLYETYLLGDTPTDNWFVCVNGADPIPDLIIGRLFVKTTEDVNNIINKIKAYEQGTAGAWTKRILLASDQGTEFENVSDELAALLPEGFTADKLYLSAYGAVEQATNDLVNKINAGSLITNYTGHGSVDNWAGEFLSLHTPDDKDSIPRNDVDRLTNGDRLTFVMTLNCLNGLKNWPNVPEFRLNLGNYHLVSNAYKEALAEYEVAIQLDPTLPEAWYFAGQAQARLGRLDRALEAWKKVRELRPDFPNIDELVLATEQQLKKGTPPAPSRPGPAPH